MKTGANDGEPMNIDKGIVEILTQEKERERKDIEILEKVKNKVSEEIYKEILFQMEESGYTYDYKIIDEPVGEIQSEPDNIIDVYAVQSFGYFRDDFHGTVCVSLPCGKYLLWSFYM